MPRSPGVSREAADDDLRDDVRGQRDGQQDDGEIEQRRDLGLRDCALVLGRDPAGKGVAGREEVERDVGVVPDHLGDGDGLTEGAAQAEEERSDEPREEARRYVESVFAARGWTVPEDHPGFTALVEALARMSLLNQRGFFECVGRYAELAEAIAEVDIDLISGHTDVADVVEKAVLGTVLGDVVITALRRNAQEQVFNRRMAQGG